MTFANVSGACRTAIFAAVVMAASVARLQAGTGTLDTPSYKITVDIRCPEGEVTCGDVKYVGVNKETGEKIKLTGKTAHHYDADGTPTRMLGYIFKNDDVTYFLSEEGELRITRGDKVLLKESGTWTWE